MKYVKKVVVAIVLFASLACHAKRCPVCCGSGKTYKSITGASWIGARHESTCSKCGGSGSIQEVSHCSPSQRRKDIEVRKANLREFLESNGISCSNRTQLAEINNAIVRKCLKEDDELCSKLSDLHNEGDFPTIDEFPKRWAYIYEKKDGVWVKDQYLVIQFPFMSSDYPSKKIKIKEPDVLDYHIDVDLNYKKNCDVHKWDEECLPKFGGDYYTYDIKTKYAANRMKAYELFDKGLLKCSCAASKIEMENMLKIVRKKAMEKFNADMEEFNKIKGIKTFIESFENTRFEDGNKLKACEMAFRDLDKISELSRKYR